MKPVTLPTTHTMFFQPKNESINCVKNLSNILGKNLFSSFSVFLSLLTQLTGVCKTGLIWSGVWTVNYQIETCFFFSCSDRFEELSFGNKYFVEILWSFAAKKSHVLSGL